MANLKRPRLLSVSIVLITVIAITGVGFAISFYRFLDQMHTQVVGLPHADGIVVLTGDRGRIGTGMNLFQANHADRMLITGVDRRVSKTALKQITGADNWSFYCCIDIDREAEDTLGNAVHAAKWATQHHMQRIIVVTSDYHMPRSLHLMSQTMPNIQLIAAPVVSKQETTQRFLSMVTDLRVLREYAKYMVANTSLEPFARIVLAHTIHTFKNSDA